MKFQQRYIQAGAIACAAALLLASYVSRSHSKTFDTLVCGFVSYGAASMASFMLLPESTSAESVFSFLCAIAGALGGFYFHADADGDGDLDAHEAAALAHGGRSTDRDRARRRLDGA